MSIGLDTFWYSISVYVSHGSTHFREVWVSTVESPSPRAQLPKRLLLSAYLQLEASAFGEYGCLNFEAELPFHIGELAFFIYQYQRQNKWLHNSFTFANSSNKSRFYTDLCPKALHKHKEKYKRPTKIALYSQKPFPMKWKALAV